MADEDVLMIQDDQSFTFQVIGINRAGNESVITRPVQVSVSDTTVLTVEELGDNVFKISTTGKLVPEDVQVNLTLPADPDDPNSKASNGHRMIRVVADEPVKLSFRPLSVDEREIPEI